jgi:hypothetical protein
MKSLKQKVTTVSSTSAELLGLSNMFDFLRCAQVTPFTVYQDNISTIMIAYMGRSSTSHDAKRRFIDIRYFWYKEHLETNFAELAVYFASADHPADDDLLASIRTTERSGVSSLH